MVCPPPFPLFVWILLTPVKIRSFNSQVNIFDGANSGQKANEKRKEGRGRKKKIRRKGRKEGRKKEGSFLSQW
jgi:hypothetical protein